VGSNPSWQYASAEMAPAVPKPLPTADEAREGGFLAAENAQRLLRAADAAAGVGSYGAAIGIAVLALEEAAKARACFGLFAATRVGARFGFSDKQFRGLIYGPHEFRHVAAFWQGVSSETRTALLTGAYPGDPAQKKRVEADLTAGEWLQSANAHKEHGFYVDFAGAGSWTGPGAVTEADWVQAEAVAQPFVAEALLQAERARSIGRASL
jgi:AbiV family abortive infection protein